MKKCGHIHAATNRKKSFCYFFFFPYTQADKQQRNNVFTRKKRTFLPVKKESFFEEKQV